MGYLSSKWETQPKPKRCTCISHNSFIDTLFRMKLTVLVCQWPFSMQVLRWNLAIATAAKKAKWRRAISLMKGLQDQDLQPDIITFNTTLRACTRASRWPVAVKIFHVMKDQKLRPDAVSFTSLLGFQKDPGGGNMTKKPHVAIAIKGRPFSQRKSIKKSPLSSRPSFQGHSC